MFDQIHSAFLARAINEQSDDDTFAILRRFALVNREAAKRWHNAEEAAKRASTIVSPVHNNLYCLQWIIRGKRCRVENIRGCSAWYQNGELHKINGPAMTVEKILSTNKKIYTQYWYQYGKRHRIDGPAVECSIGYRAWYQNGWLHRIDGPAVEYGNGQKEWHQNGKLHRLDGPAIEPNEWWVDGKFVGSVASPGTGTRSVPVSYEETRKMAITTISHPI